MNPNEKKSVTSHKNKDALKRNDNKSNEVIICKTYTTVSKNIEKSRHDMLCHCISSRDCIHSRGWNMYYEFQIWSWHSYFVFNYWPIVVTVVVCYFFLYSRGLFQNRDCFRRNSMRICHTVVTKNCQHLDTWKHVWYSRNDKSHFWCCSWK